VKLLLLHSDLKYFLAILFFSALHLACFSQDSGQMPKAKDTVLNKPVTLAAKDSSVIDTTKKNGIQKKPVIRKLTRADSLRRDSIRLAFVRTTLADSLLSDSLKRDSLSRISPRHTVAKRNLAEQKKTTLMPGSIRNDVNTDLVFYILIFLLFLLALIKTSFPKYVNSIFSLSFQATFRQTQTKDQMAQNFFPAFMLNVLFVFCGGLFITLFATYNKWTDLPFWQLFVFSTIILLIVYLVKYIVINFTGWVFNVREAAAEYSFVVFLINKLFAVVSIPLLFLIAYSEGRLKTVSITIVLCLAVFCLVVRYLVSLSRIRRNLKITAFHFFIYLWAVEIMPLLVIYKVLFLQTGNR